MPDRNLTTQYLFKSYTRAQWREEFGSDAPAFDPTKPQKSWFDTAAAATSRRFVVYDQALATGPDGITPRLTENGNPYFEPLVIPRDEVGTVNLAPERGMTGHAEAPYPVPCKPLTSDEVLVLAAGPMGGSIVMVRNLKEWESEQNEVDGFRKGDREMLRAVLVETRKIAAKLGV